MKLGEKGAVERGGPRESRLHRDKLYSQKNSEFQLLLLILLLILLLSLTSLWGSRPCLA